jgi:16S rRNA (uracil1498-N3)-methyltransferase
MRSPRVYADLPLAAGARVTLPAAQSQHLTLVLRLAAGDPVILFNGDGRDYDARLLDAHRTGTAALCKAAGDEEPVPALRIHLGLGISKGERMDFALQKAVELGVAGITPLFTARSVVRLDPERLAKRHAHWGGVMIAACEQSGRRRLPGLGQAARLEDWLTLGHPGGILLDHRSATPLPALPAPVGNLTLLVGPEGGLSAIERAAARAAGFTGVCLGPRILRTETAPLAAIAAIQALWGDFAEVPHRAGAG